LRSTLEAMTETLRARGPDSCGHLLRTPVALGHRRLSILDLTAAGAQPMERPQGISIAYNGECYNFTELREELKHAGLGFRGQSDTEVILNAYAAWGLDGLKRLEGIFAFALWDSERQRLVLMRDRLGVKPLFYGQSTFGLAFGSEIKAVLRAGGVDKTLDDQAFAEYLWYGNTYEDRTFYRGVRAVEPGHWMILEGEHQRLEPWWRIEEWLDPPSPTGGREDAAMRVRAALDVAVQRQLVADVPVGIFLSGGVDSSAIAASAVRAFQQPFTSYAAGFDFAHGVNELPKAAMVARHLKLDHHELRVTGSDLPEVLRTLARAHDEPFADAANIPLYLMCRQLSGRIKVVLQGDGGDELFGGYRRYAMLRNARWWRLWPEMLTRPMRAMGSAGMRVTRMAESVGHADPAVRMALLLTMESLKNPPESVLTPGRRERLAATTDPFLAYRRAAERFAEHDEVQQMLLTDLTLQLPSQFLTKVDRATMAAGIEARVPLLDERVAELVVGMPSRWKVDRTEKKILLRQSQRGRLPDTILNGPKTGFGVPYGHWMRTSLRDFARERLLDRELTEEFSLEPGAVERLFREVSNGQQGTDFKLWKLLQLALWKESAV
jgi:asparagine synthase (glutamine-hydrolysing)